MPALNARFKHGYEIKKESTGPDSFLVQTI